MERIAFAAIKREDNHIVFGKSHSECFQVTPMAYVTKATQGFLTDSFRFVTRTEAAKIAFQAGQIKKDVGALISEMLWDKRDGGLHDYDSKLGYVKRKKKKAVCIVPAKIADNAVMPDTFPATLGLALDLGLVGDEAIALSKSIDQLGTDVASFNKKALAMPSSSKPLPDLVECSECGWLGPVIECPVEEEGDYESGYHNVPVCPVCPDGGRLDDYSYSANQWKKLLAWQALPKAQKLE